MVRGSVARKVSGRRKLRSWETARIFQAAPQRRPHRGRFSGVAGRARRPQRVSAEERAERGAGEEQRADAGQESPGDGGDQRRGCRQRLGGNPGREVATDPGEIVPLVPQVQKELLHGAQSTRAALRNDVRMLTVMQLAGPRRRTYASYAR